MAKKKQDLPSENERAQQLFKNVAVKFGGLTMQEITNNCAGFPIPYYAERYVRDSNVYITGKCEMYVGGQGSGKSSYGFHVAKVFLGAGGYFFLIETENKLSPVSLRANLGNDYFNSGRVQLIPAGSVDMDTEGADDKHLQSWQSALSGIVKLVREQNLTHVPVYILVDSILGASGAESRKEYDEEGQNKGRSTSDMARAASITRFLSNFVVDLRGTNILVGFTNHGKTKIQMGGMPARGTEQSIPGGDAIGFHCSLILWFERGGKDISAAVAGRNTRIGCYKNSFGGEERKVDVGFYYDHVRDENGQVVVDHREEYSRVINWTWHEATAELLKNFCSKDNYHKTLSSAEARGLITLHDKGGNLGCQELGHTDLVSFEQFGKDFESRPDVEHVVRGFPKLGICQYPVIEYKDD